MARSDLVLAVLVALADPGPRPVALGLGMAADEGGGDDLAVRVGLALLAVAIAAVTWRLVEEPFRRGRLTLWGRARGVALAGATALILVLGSTAIGVVGDREVAAAAALEADAASTDDFLRRPCSTIPSRCRPAPRKPSHNRRRRQVGRQPPALSPTVSMQPSAPPRPTPRIDGALPRI